VRTGTRRRAPTWDSEALGVLAGEFPFSDRALTEAKIRGRLKRKKLGDYDAARVAVLRRFKDALQKEIGKGERSRFFAGSRGRYVDVRDFDVARLTKDMAARHPGVPKREVRWFVPFAVFLYHAL
jgi:hypothetical protein